MGPLFAKPRLVGKCRLGRWGVNLVEANRRVNLVELKGQRRWRRNCEGGYGPSWR
jgi:hypothetical protein